MITLYNKDGKTVIGELSDVISCIVTLEDKGMFDLELEYPLNGIHFNSLNNENIIVADATPELKAQMFRITNTVKQMDNTVIVYARHISYDLLSDVIEGDKLYSKTAYFLISNIFRNSNHSSHFTAESDIINTLDWIKFPTTTCMDALFNKDYGVVHKFGNYTGVIRDNYKFGLYNRIGHDNGVSIEYKKNLKGIDVTENIDDLCTKILAYATYDTSDTKLSGTPNTEIEIPNAKKGRATVSAMKGKTVLRNQAGDTVSPSADAFFFSCFEEYKYGKNAYQVTMKCLGDVYKDYGTYTLKEPLRGFDNTVCDEIALDKDNKPVLHRRIGQTEITYASIKKVGVSGDYKIARIPKEGIFKSVKKSATAKLLSSRYPYSANYGANASNVHKMYQDKENIIFCFPKTTSDQAIKDTLKSTWIMYELDEYKQESVNINTKIFEGGKVILYMSYLKADFEFIYDTHNVVYAPNKYVESSIINKYSHPYIKIINFTDSIKEGVIPTPQMVKDLAEKYFIDTQCDYPRVNYDIDFIPLSRCVGYEHLNENVSLGDTVTVKDERYNIDIQANVVKVRYNPLTELYEGIELGEPKDRLLDSIHGNNGADGSDGLDGINGADGTDGLDGNDGLDGEVGEMEYPDILPDVSILTGKSVGLSSIELQWTYEGLVFFEYELYASKSANFNPSSVNLIFEGKASSYLFSAKPNETWYFKVRAKNSHGSYTDFSNEVSVSTAKVDANDWIEKATIGDALIGNISADKINAGTVSGHYIDARNLSVTDGNGNRTLDVDSFGRVSLDVNSLKIHSTTLTDWTNNKWNTNWSEKTQAEFFNKITSNGAIKGIFMENGHLYINASYLRGTIIEGMQLKTAEPSATGGVWIKKDGMQLGSTSLFYSNNNFKIEAEKNISISSLGDIYLMPSSYVNVDGRLNASQLTLGDATSAYIKYSSFYSQWASGNLSTWGLRLNGAVLLGTSSGNIHVVNSSGSKGGLYATTYSSYSLEEAINTQSEDIKATDIIESATVVNECVIPSAPYSVDSQDMNKYISYNEESKMYDMNINNTVALLWKSIQELKEENRELREMLSKIT